MNLKARTQLYIYSASRTYYAAYVKKNDLLQQEYGICTMDGPDEYAIFRFGLRMSSEYICMFV